MRDPDSVTDQPRAIVHLDLDAFFAAVEILENSDLAGKPVVVGGSPGGRGVISSASYLAREFGLRSAMPTARALALCPDVIIVQPRHRVYSEYSKRVMSILRRASPAVQQASIDEAYLDLSDQVSTWGAAIEVARLLQLSVREQVGLSASLGVATNKLVAKVASDRDKPGGLTVVRPGEEASFLAPLPVRVLWGIGPVTARKLSEMSITTVGDLALVPKALLQRKFGRHGPDMARKALGQDTRPVYSDRDPKSVSQERTFSRDITRREDLEERLQQLSHGVGRRLRKTGAAASTIAIKLRYSDFSTISRQMSLSVPTDDQELIFQASLSLFYAEWQQGRPVRLLGVAARRLTSPSGQLRLC